MSTTLRVYFSNFKDTKALLTDWWRVAGDVWNLLMYVASD